MGISFFFHSRCQLQLISKTIKVNKRERMNLLSQKEMTVYEVTVYIFTWRKEKYDCSKSLGTEKWELPFHPPPVCLFLCHSPPPTEGTSAAFIFGNATILANDWSLCNMPGQCLMWPWRPFGDCCASSTPPACALSNAMQAGLSKALPKS